MAQDTLTRFSRTWTIGWRRTTRNSHKNSSNNRRPSRNSLSQILSRSSRATTRMSLLSRKAKYSNHSRIFRWGRWTRERTTPSSMTICSSKISIRKTSKTRHTTATIRASIKLAPDTRSATVKSWHLKFQSTRQKKTSPHFSMTSSIPHHRSTFCIGTSCSKTSKRSIIWSISVITWYFFISQYQLSASYFG